MDTFFLLNLRISGIKNIEKPVEIPFYKKTIKDDFNPDQYRIKGIYGENGSGKTAIMTAVNIMTRMILEKNYLTDSVNQQLLVECINKKTGKVTIKKLTKRGTYRIKVKVKAIGNAAYKPSAWKTVTFRIRVK